MIKFFRKIRQNLLSEGKIKSYLMYAIGEILLVMIGILLALQVSNWNEKLKKEQKTIELVKVLITDMKGAIEENKADRSFGNRFLSSYDSLIISWERDKNIDTTYLKEGLWGMGADMGHTYGNSPVAQTLSTSDLWEELPDTIVSSIDKFYASNVEKNKTSFGNLSKYAFENKINFLMLNDLIILNRPTPEIVKLLEGQEEVFIRRLKLIRDGTKLLVDRFSQAINQGEEIIKMLEKYPEK